MHVVRIARLQTTHSHDRRLAKALLIGAPLPGAARLSDFVLKRLRSQRYDCADLRQIDQSLADALRRLIEVRVAMTWALRW